MFWKSCRCPEQQEFMELEGVFVYLKHSWILWHCYLLAVLYSGTLHDLHSVNNGNSGTTLEPPSFDA